MSEVVGFDLMGNKMHFVWSLIPLETLLSTRNNNNTNRFQFIVALSVHIC